jgi:ApaG protein
MNSMKKSAVAVVCATFAVANAMAAQALAQSSCRPEACRAGMAIAVLPRFIDDESSPRAGRYLWAYEVRIEKRLDIAVRLRGREWTVTDADNNIEALGGAGLVGEKPLLPPNTGHRYTSWLSLKTAIGRLEGAIWAETADGVRFAIPIAPISLKAP